ncbi:ABC transporter substrate-binding protein [Massilia sp. CF038]|uniref:substrate-binding periplasmic protein n=1 Tax=Massilia sp. CF038 TaxID=1881045 RepID=UPI0009141A89|nr:transporter substrate-binding domain-containing protein [Massilia sp. CF038]SHH62170.1 amino acid ABC transporter substrate-binding protein, PAAT family [Massilia sp. CF038]
MSMLLAGLPLLAVADASPRPRLYVVTELGAPAATLDNGRLAGFAVDKVRQILARAGVEYEIDVLPWKRAYLLAQTRSDACIFSVSRIPERDALFKWVGPTHTTDWTLYGRAGRKYQVTVLEDARKYRIGAYFGDVRGETLSAQGYLVDTVHERLANPRKLLLDRIDLWVSSTQNGGPLIADNGWSGKIVPVLTFRQTGLYLACNTDVADTLITRMNMALSAMNSEGVSNAIERKYNYGPRR